MRINKIEIQGFRSFEKAQTLDFSALTPGLYQISGTNLVEPELEGNGVGKSSLFDAVCWALYDKTSRGLKGPQVKNWNNKEKCAGFIDLQTTSGQVSIARTWQPNALKLSKGGSSAIPVNQQEVEDVVGLSLESFLYSIYFAQFTPAFADLKPAEQTNIFTSVLNLAVWERASELAASTFKDGESKINELKEKRARFQGQADELLQNNYADLERKWQKTHRIELEDAKKRKREVEKTEAQAKIRYERANTAVHGAQQLKSQHDAQAYTMGACTTAVQLLEKALAEIQDKNRKICPACNQPITEGHKKAEAQKIKHKLETETQKLTEAIEKHSTLSKQLESLRSKENEMASASKALTLAQSELKQTERELQQTLSQENPYTLAREEVEQRGAQLVHDMELIDKQLDTATTQSEHMHFWIKAFKEIRLSMIKESLDQLTLEANEVLYQLGLHDWAVAFDIERENKSGGITRAFTIMIKAPHVETSVPWEVWSGGESQRLRLSISMGFANLICNRLGVKPNVEFWDEPSTWLSEAGIRDLLDVLSERAVRMQKVILLADHRSLDSGAFAGVIKLVKDANGSRILV